MINQGAKQMKSQLVRVFAMVAAVMLLSMTVLEINAHARAGGSRKRALALEIHLKVAPTT